MHLLPWDVTADVAQRQIFRYRQMTPTEKLACADALWDLAWSATLAGVKMRNPGLSDAEAARAAHRVLDDASD